MLKPLEPNSEADKHKALELLLCCLNENFIDQSSIGSIIKKVTIEFDSQFDDKPLPRPLAPRFAARQSTELCPIYSEEGRIVSWERCPTN